MMDLQLIKEIRTLRMEGYRLVMNKKKPKAKAKTKTKTGGKRRTKEEKILAALLAKNGLTMEDLKQ